MPDEHACIAPMVCPWAFHQDTASCNALLFGRVGVLFEDAGCNTPAVRGLLGSSGVQDNNLVQYLGIIEQRAHELLQVRC